MTYTEEHKNEKMTAKDWNDVDYDSRKMAIKLLKSLGCKDIVESTGKCCYDILAEMTTSDGTIQRIAVECKNRDEKAYSRFNDVMIEQIKLDSLLARLRNHEYDKILIINTYPHNNRVRIANGQSLNYKSKTLPCPKWSRVKGVGHQIEWKECVLFQNVKESEV